jgi:threonine aldolase
MHYQESGAAESIAGCKLITVLHKNGKAVPEEIVRKLLKERAFGKHSTCPRILSIAQPTEVGTVYTIDELKTLSILCREQNLLLHMDGSRIYNAAVFLDSALDQITSAASVDLLSIGGTKNGLMFAEALLVMNSSLLAGCEHLQKQALQLVSKMRYLSAQYIPFFKNGLWHQLASHANQKAGEIADLIRDTPGLSLSYPVETNQIFFTAPAAWVPLIQEKILCYPWDAEKNEIRWIASWNTSEKEVASVKTILNHIAWP